MCGFFPSNTANCFRVAVFFIENNISWFLGIHKHETVVTAKIFSLWFLYCNCTFLSRTRFFTIFLSWQTAWYKYPIHIWKIESVRVVFPKEEGHALHCLVLVKGPYFLPSFAACCFHKFGCGCVQLNVWLMQVHVKSLPYLYVSLLPEWLLRQVYQVCQIQMIKQYLNCRTPGHRHPGLDLTTCSDTLHSQQADRLASSITD